jgi:hypothetical protein
MNRFANILGALVILTVPVTSRAFTDSLSHISKDSKYTFIGEIRSAQIVAAPKVDHNIIVDVAAGNPSAGGMVLVRAQVLVKELIDAPNGENLKAAEIDLCVREPLAVGSSYLFFVKSEIAKPDCTYALGALKIYESPSQKPADRGVTISQTSIITFPESIPFYPATLKMEAPANEHDGGERSIVLTSFARLDDVTKFIREQRTSLNSH